MMPGWLRPLWAIVARSVKKRLHELVDSITETRVERFKLALHEQIERL